jgi:hypothetical protein
METNMTPDEPKSNADTKSGDSQQKSDNQQSNQDNKTDNTDANLLLKSSKDIAKVEGSHVNFSEAVKNAKELSTNTDQQKPKDESSNSDSSNDV